MTYDSPELKLKQKVRSLLIANSTISSYTSSRVYTSHISTINQPVYPAISMTSLLPSERFDSPIVEMQLQLDIWMEFKNNNPSDLEIVSNEIRSELHRQNISDVTVGLNCCQLFEVPGGQIVPHDNFQTWQLPTIYRTSIR